MNIVSLPAGSGDCFVITWGSPKRAMVIDAGRAGCFKTYLRPHLEGLASEGLTQIELAVATHIDEDHMEGLIEWVKVGAEVPVKLREIWFNGRPQLPSDGIGSKSVRQGEALSNLLAGGSVPWNNAFGGGAAMAHHEGRFPDITLPGSMRVTLLGPGPGEMRELADKWEEEMSKAMVPMEREIKARKKPPTPRPLQVDVWSGTPWAHEDVGATNLSSITCLLEHDGKSALFTGDADPSIVLTAWKRLVQERGKPVRLDLLKLNHHGSRKNCSPELVKALKPRKVLVSSDGSIYGHPEKESLSYVVKHSPNVELFFNYDNAYTQAWTDPSEQAKWGYTAQSGDGLGIEVRL